VAHGYRHAWLEFLQSGDDEPVTSREATGHDPLISNGAIELDEVLLHLVVGTHDESRCGAIRGVGDTLLRREDCTLTYAFLDRGMHEHARKQQIVRVGKDRSQRHRARALV